MHYKVNRNLLTLPFEPKCRLMQHVFSRVNGFLLYEWLLRHFTLCKTMSTLRGKILQLLSKVELSF